MAVAYRSTLHRTYGGTPSTNIKFTGTPAGLAVDDIILIFVHIEESGGTVTPSAAGYTLLDEHYGILGTHGMDGAVLWKRATASDLSAASVTVSWTGSYFSTGDMHAFSGCITSGSPFVGDTMQSGGGSATIPSVSYTAGDGLGIWIFTNYMDAGTVTLPSGYTQEYAHNDGDLTLASRTDTAGATSSGTGTASSTDSSVIFVGTLIPPAAAPPPSVTASVAWLTA